MKKLPGIVAAFLILAMAGCAGPSDSEVSFVGSTSRWILTNGLVSVIVKAPQGIYEIVRATDQKKIVTGAYLKIDGDSTNEPLRKADYALSDFTHGGITGKYLLVTSSKEGKNGLGIRFGLLPGKDFVVIDAGIMNRGDSVLQVKEISVLTRGELYGGRKLMPGFRMLDGNGGGEDTRVTGKTALDCRNNLLLTWGKPRKREALVAGGLTYTEIEKFVKVEPASQHNGPLKKLAGGLGELVHLDAGKADSAGGSEVTARVVRGRAYHWETGFGNEYDNILFDEDEVVLTVSGLRRDGSYAIGVDWSDDADTRRQSVAWSGTDGALHPLLPATKLPSHGAGDPPERIWMNLPAEALKQDTLFVHIRNEGGVNAVIGGFLVAGGQVKDERNGKPEPAVPAVTVPEDLLISLYAADPVGKRVDPGQSWFPEDAFYLSAGNGNPFAALEQYGRELKDFQGITLQYYTFPTICLWYAQHKAYGGGPSVNDAPGAVAEMDRAVKSGFLKYGPVCIRLVPDAYEANNEQGWWDDKHWQMYGTGKYAVPPDGNVDVPPGHYKKPYETTRKWARAVIERGGIPITYFQTGRRSDDYAAAHPGHMLFNDTRGVPDNDWMIRGKAGYDFTDPGFLEHMRVVYKNLSDGGVQGLMYDYPYTAWARFGGMEDPYSTTSAAYRTVFQLARDGLGQGAFLDERNLDHGSDITLGIVSSQRIWGDTDRMSPLMITRGALRWYKNRQVISYDMDAKNLLKAQPANRDGVRKMLTILYTTCGRFLMANSFDRLTPDMVHDLSRIFPYPDSWVSARPVDAFCSRYPEIFSFRIDEGWYQLAVYNPDDQHPAVKTIRFNAPDYFDAINLDPDQDYYAWEFWDNRSAGEFSGSDSLRIELRPGEAKMISIRAKEDFPQLLSSDRHIMQGLVETRDLMWNPQTLELTGEINLVGNETMNLVFAGNGFVPQKVTTEDSTSKVISQGEFFMVIIVSGQPGWKRLSIQFLKP
jgi:hypothetical protein